MKGNLEKLIAKIEAANDQARASGAADNVVLIGEILWNQVLSENATTAEQEAAVIKYANTITSAVKGFSDYSDCFWEVSHFLELAIANLSPKAALQCAHVGVDMYGTEHTSDSFNSGWAEACIARCVGWLTVDPASGFTDGDIANIKAACGILKVVAEGGEEYRELFQGSAALNEAVTNTLSLAEGNSGNTLFASANLARLAPTAKLLREITALCSNSPDEVLSCLEMSVDLDSPKSWTGEVLLEAYNAMCEEQPADLALQLKASQGPLAQLAVKALQTCNEGKQGKKHLFMEAAMFVQLLLSPWHKDDAGHMETKTQIATALCNIGVLDALLRHFTFWVVEWGKCYGDAGRPVFIALYELMRYFPDVVNAAVLGNEHAVALIRQAATVNLNNIYLVGPAYETAESAAKKMVCLLDGTELPAEPVANAGAPGGMAFMF